MVLAALLIARLIYCSNEKGRGVRTPRPFSKLTNPAQVSFVSSVLLKKIATSVQTTPESR